MHNTSFFISDLSSLILCLQPEDFWIKAPRKGLVVFALPGEPGLTELMGDFKIHFHDRQGDFYWFVNCLCCFTFFYNALVVNEKSFP